MPTITLIVKGDIPTALRAVQARRLPEPISIAATPKWRQCVLSVADTTSWETLTEWFFEHTREGAPFPDGTLLWFGPSKD